MMTLCIFWVKMIPRSCTRFAFKHYRFHQQVALVALYESLRVLHLLRISESSVYQQSVRERYCNTLYGKNYAAFTHHFLAPRLPAWYRWIWSDVLSEEGRVNSSGQFAREQEWGEDVSHQIR